MIKSEFDALVTGYMARPQVLRPKKRKYIRIEETRSYISTT